MTDPLDAAHVAVAAPVDRRLAALAARARAACSCSARTWLALPTGAGGLLPGALQRPAAGVRSAPASACWSALAFGAWLGLKNTSTATGASTTKAWRCAAAAVVQRETRVPATRVQHLDLKRGPLQRGRSLATLVVHTAGTRHSAVTVPHLDADDAERLRDRLSRPDRPR